MAAVLGAVGVASELLGIFSELRLAYASLSDRVEKFRENPDEFHLLKNDLTTAKEHVKACNDTLEKYRRDISDRSLKHEQISLQRIAVVLRMVQKSAVHLEEKFAKRRLRKFGRAKTIARDIGNQSSRIVKTKEELSHVIDNLKKIVEENDIFKPDFSSIPTLRFPVHLEFWKPDTMEGRLIETLLEQVKYRGRDSHASHVTTVVGAKGMGGVGKTTALCKLAELRVVRDAFPDGIHFIVVGKDATPAGLVIKLKRIIKNSGGKRLADDINDSEALESAVRTTSTWFKNKRALFICDDLWQTPFSRSGYYKEMSGLLYKCPQSHMMISTRNEKIGPQGSAKVKFEPRRATGDEARGIFLKSCGLYDQRVHDTENSGVVDEILELCQGVALTLSIAGRQVRLHDGPPKDSLNHLLKSIRKRRFSVWEEETPEEYPCFAETVEGSLLEIAACLEKDRIFMERFRNSEHGDIDGRQEIRQYVSDRFHRLCILPRTARVTKDTIFRAWCISNEEIGWKMLDALRDSHLVLEFDSTDEDDEFVFGLHDVILDHCIEESKNRGNNSYSRFHREFLMHTCESNGIVTKGSSGEELNAFWRPEECMKPRPWWEIVSNEISVPEKYILLNLFRHLREGGRLAEAVGLLSHEKWTRLRVNYGGIARLKVEFELVKKAMSMQSPMVVAQEKSSCKIAIEGISSLWNMTSKEWPRISNDPGSLPTHAFGYFVRNGNPNWIVERYLQSAEKFATSPWIKPRPGFMHISEAEHTTFDVNGYIKGISVMWEARRIIAATFRRLFWINMKTMGAMHSEELEIYDDEVQSIAVCEKKNLLVLGLKSGRLQFLNASTGKSTEEPLCRHDDAVSSVAICAEGRTVVSGSEDMTVRVWDSDSSSAVCEPLCGHEKDVRSVAVSANGRTLVSGSWDNMVWVRAHTQRLGLVKLWGSRYRLQR